MRGVDSPLRFLEWLDREPLASLASEVGDAIFERQDERLVPRSQAVERNAGQPHGEQQEGNRDHDLHLEEGGTSSAQRNPTSASW